MLQFLTRIHKTMRYLCFVFFIFSVLLTYEEPKVWANPYLKIGILEEPKTLNIWLAGDAWSKKVLNLIYQPLYIREPKDLKLIPWLAEGEPEYDPKTLSFTVKLRSAKWSDGSDVTSEDVAFTGNLIKDFKIPRYYASWKFIRKIEPVEKHTVRFLLEEPRAIFLTRTLTTPIVQQKEWASVAKQALRQDKPLNRLLNVKIKQPVGTGPFILDEWKQGAYLFLKKNAHFFGKGKEIGGYLLGPHMGGIILKLYGTSDAAILAIKRGNIDLFWWGIQPGYLSDLRKQQDVRVVSSEKSALYYLGYNLRRAPFDDLNFRRAIAVLIDKDFIVKRILQGQARKMHSVIPSGNTFWHLAESPENRDGFTRYQRIRKACQILKNAGYGWKVPPVNERGKIVKAERIILPDGRPMQRFTILTPPADYDPHRAMAGIMIQEWLRMVGLPAFAKPMAFSALTHQVEGRRQFDLFVLGYGNLSLDPDYLRNFFHSSNDRPRGWNASGYRNPHFDQISDESARLMDVEKRRELIREMQRVIMRDIPFLPLYNPHLIEALRTDRFQGWVPMLGGVGNTWSFCRLRPK
ncbi:ABC transporter substrate-binding protein [Thermodesulfobacteriota bacterium]